MGCLKMAEERKTKLKEAYDSIVGDYPIESVCAVMLREELEELLDFDLTQPDFEHILRENAKVYKVFLYKYKPDSHYGFIVFNNKRIGEIGIELKEELYNGVKYV